MDAIAIAIFVIVGWTVGTVQTAWALRAPRVSRPATQLLLTYEAQP